VRIPKSAVQTTWKADWLLEFSIALVLLGTLTREIIFAAVGIGILSALAVLGLIFSRRLAILRTRVHVEERLSRGKVLLGDSVDGELKIRNDARLAAQISRVQGILQKGLRLELQPLTSKQPVEPGTTYTSTFRILPLARGRFRISGFQLTLTDPRELFTGDVKFEEARWIEVYPETEAVHLGTGAAEPLTPLAFYGGVPEIFRKSPSGDDYAGIREYAAGDEYYKVEWKATARLRKLMVKEFHPETEATVQILIDAGETMQQRSYVGTRLDEALAVAQLLIESAALSGNRVGISVYDENDVVRAMKPAAANERLVDLRDLALTLRAHVETMEPAARTPSPRVLLLGKPVLAGGERLTTFLRFLKLRLRWGYGNTGVYKTLKEVSVAGLAGFAIVLTDLQVNNEALLEAASIQRERGLQTIVAQIGAAWRLSGSLEDAYVEYEKNNRTIGRSHRLGMTILDVRPERLVKSTIQELGLRIGIPPLREVSR
jgi:uncharacterized protein (DUF58 family)